jgi:hypothetical protein
MVPLLKRFGLTVLPLLLLGAVVVILISQAAPYCMDEFLQYNEIIYGHYPANNLNTFNEAAHLYDLNLYNSGLILPLRCYYYMGVLPALYYYPLFLVWQDPLSARFLGIIFLFLQAMVLCRILGIRTGYLYLSLLLFFPYMFLHVAETGMVGPQILCLLVIYMLVLRWFQTFKPVYPIGIALYSFLGIWVKLSFLWYGPALLAILFHQLYENRHRLCSRDVVKKFAGHAGTGLVVLLLLLSVLFLSTDPADPTVFPYWDELVKSGDGEGLELYSTLWNPMRATENVMTPADENLWSSVYSSLLYAVTPVLWLLLLLLDRRGPKVLLWRSVVLYGCFWLTILMIFRTSSAWSMHHTILAYPFLILSFLSALVALRSLPVRVLERRHYRRLLLVGLCVFIVLNGHPFTVFSRQQIVPENEPSRIELNAALKTAELARGNMYVVLDWGMYFYQALYGHPQQSVLYIEPMGPGQLQELVQLREQSGRRVLVLYHPDLPGHNGLAAMIRRFGLVSCNLTGNSDAAGNTWQVMIEEDLAGEFCL